jgi:hypothetical protein
MSEAVLGGTKAGEIGGILGAQKRVEGQFGFQLGGYGWHAGGAQTFNLAGMVGKGGAVGVHGDRKAGVGERIFMAAIDFGFRIERGKFLQAFKELLRCTLEHPPTTHGEQRVGDEGQFLIV